MPNKQRFTVSWLGLALQDMQEALAYIAQEEDPDAAHIVAGRIWQAGQGLSGAPERGRPGRVPGTRELLVQNLPYFLAYRVRGQSVQILRVLHTARQWPHEL